MHCRVDPLWCSTASHRHTCFIKQTHVEYSKANIPCQTTPRKYATGFFSALKGSYFTAIHRDLGKKRVWIVAKSMAFYTKLRMHSYKHAQIITKHVTFTAALCFFLVNIWRRGKRCAITWKSNNKEIHLHILFMRITCIHMLSEMREGAAVLRSCLFIARKLEEKIDLKCQVMADLSVWFRRIHNEGEKNERENTHFAYASKNCCKNMAFP